MKILVAFLGHCDCTKWPRVLITVLALMSTTLLVPVWPQAQQKPPDQILNPPSIDHILERIKASPVSLTSPIERAEKDGTANHLSLKDVTLLALKNNLNIAIENTQEDLKQLAVVQAKSYLDPSINLSGSHSKSNSTPTDWISQATAGYINTSMSDSWNVSISQPIPTGGSFSLGWSTSRSDNNNVNTLTTPLYGTSASLSFSQPLWRNLKVDGNRNGIKIANMDLKLNDAQFKQQITQTIASIQKDYWQLVSAIYRYQLAVGSVNLARESAATAKNKLDIGMSAPIEYTQSLASQASREVSVIQDEEEIISQENNLKNLIAPDRNNEIWKQMIVPTDTPEFVEYAVDLDKAIATAIQNSLQLQQDDINLQKSDLGYALTKEGKKWNVSFSSSIGSSGTGGVQAYRTDLYGVLRPVLADNFVGGLITSYKTIFNGGTYNWRVGFNVTIPLRNSNVEASLATARINRQNLVTTRTQHEQQIVVDIKNYVQALNTARRQLDAAIIGRQLSEAQLETMNMRFEAGIVVQYEVLNSQDQLANAQASELSAKINYKSAIINLQEAMSTLLEEGNITLATDTNKSKKLAFR